jgi:DNA polymerase-1
MTKTGSPSLGKDHWQTLRQFDLTDEGSRAVDLYETLLETSNAATTVKQLAAALGDDGRIHPKIVPLGTDTGRTSSRSPNLQNLSSSNPMRNIFISDEGYTMLSIDFDSLEAKAAAALSQDPNLLAATAPGADMHQATADNLGIDRKPAKTLGYQILFGGGARAVAASLRIPFDEARQLVGDWWGQYPELSRLNSGLKQRTDFVPLIDGRRVKVPRFTSGDQAGEYRTYANLNYLIQGSSAILAKSRWLYVAQTLGLSDAVLMFVHDELLLQVPTDDAARVVDLLDAMNFEYLGVQFTAGVAELYDSEGISRWVAS